MRFLCDQMLVGLGKWLRAAGYDTLIITSSIADEEIFIMAKADGRLLLTRDHHFLLMEGNDGIVCYLNANTLSDCVHELSTKLGVNWLHNPFSRCLICNTLFIEPSDQELLKQVPADVRAKSSPISYCPTCNKIYWQGVHTKRMLLKLESWAVKKDIKGQKDNNNR